MVQGEPGRRYGRKPSLPNLRPPAGRLLQQHFSQHLLPLVEVGFWMVEARSRHSSTIEGHRYRFDPKNDYNHIIDDIGYS